MAAFLGKYGKFVTSVLGTAVTILSTYYGGQHWFAIAVGALTALGVYAVPNKAADPAPLPPVVTPAPPKV